MRSLLILAALTLVLGACHDRTSAVDNTTNTVQVPQDSDTANATDECPRKDGTPCR